MNVPQVIRKIKKARPQNQKDFKAMGLTLVREGSGLFRSVMRIKGVPVVVKFPKASGKDVSYRSGKMHSTVEARKIAKLYRIPWMRRYLPRVYYHDKKSGILVVSWHKEFANDVDAFRALGRFTTKLLRQNHKVTVSDIHEENVRQGVDRKQIILVDLGY